MFTKFWDHKINKLRKIKYLGIVLDSKLIFGDQINSIVQTAIVPIF